MNILFHFPLPSSIPISSFCQPRDRRQLLTTLHKLRAIHRGEAPVHPLNAPCNRCKYKERCEESGGTG
jgi:CRISPR-associated exonuclease Cas4